MGGGKYTNGWRREGQEGREEGRTRREGEGQLAFNPLLPPPSPRAGPLVEEWRWLELLSVQYTVQYSCSTVYSANYNVQYTLQCNKGYSKLYSTVYSEKYKD